MASPSIEDLKNSSVSVWNAMRGPSRLEELHLSRENPYIDDRIWPWDVDLHGAYLWKAALDGIDLSFTVLNGANLSAASLRGAVFDHARGHVYLSGAKLEQASLYKVNFSGADLTHAQLEGANLRFANLSQSKLAGANLRGADLRGANLEGANIEAADMRGANLQATNFAEANLYRADLRDCNLAATFFRQANLRRVNFYGTDLHGAMLDDVNLREANLSAANLHGCRLRYSMLVKTNIDGADFSGAHIFGMSAWQLEGQASSTIDLNIADERDPPVRVDDLEVAQFVYLLLNNQKIRQVIDTVTSKAVLILGRFTPERKAILDALREHLRKRNHVPIIFDFDQPTNRNLTETVSTLAQLSRFVIADLTDAKSIPQELQRIVPGLPSLPVQPLIHESQFEYSMFKDLLDYPWVLVPHRYHDIDSLLEDLEEKVIKPVKAKADEIIERRKLLMAGK